MRGFSPPSFSEERAAGKGAGGLGRAFVLAHVVIGLLFLVGCHTDMWVQAKVKPLAESDFYTDKQGSRPLVPNTVPRSDLRIDDGYYTGIVNGKLVDKFPFAMDKAALLRGQERFNIFCSPCHGRLGNGKGMIAQRGLDLRRQPADYHTDRLRKMPIGHFFDVITNGFGVMYPYGYRIEPEDRWKIVAYIRALQRSQDSKLDAVPKDKVPELDNPVKPNLSEEELDRTSAPEEYGTRDTQPK